MPAPFPLADVGGMGWNVLREDMTLPLAVLKLPALDHNSRWMAEFLGHRNPLAPHGKTTMSPALFERQLADGAWGMTLATVQQVRVARANGIGRIVLANQLVGRQAIDYIAAELARDPLSTSTASSIRSTASASLPNVWKPTRPAGRFR